MNTRNFVRLGAVGAAASVAMLAAGPALAAAPVAQASASALTIALAGNGAGSGTYAASTDGTNETTTGNKSPALTAVGPLKLVGLGVAAQDATTSVVNQNGNSAACAGLAGPGASIVAVGNAGSCLTGGSVLKLSPATVDLTGLNLDTLTTPDILKSILGDNAVTQAINQQVLAPVLNQLSAALQTALGQLGLGLNLNLGAITAQCNAVPGSATGSASLANAGLTLTVPTQGDITLVKLPVNPAPNTHVLTNLDQVVTAIQTALQTELNTVLNGQLAAITGPINTILTQALTAINNNLIKVIAPQLAPLEQNLLDITLNKQSGAGTDHIDVTALDLQLLPAAKQFIGNSLLSVQIGHVNCGPNSRLAVAPLAKPNQIPAHITHKVPHKVTSGLATKPAASNGHTAAYSALAGLGVIATAAGAIGVRRRLIKE